MIQELFPTATEPCAPLPPRPKANDPRVYENAVAALLPSVIRWLGNDYRPEEREEILSQIWDSLSHIFDGYECAKHLDDWYHWSVDSELVEILDRAPVTESHNALVCEWALRNQVIPRFAVGQTVTVQASRDVRDSPSKQQGEITRIDTNRAQYVVFIPSLGHVKEGVGTHGQFFNFEDVEALNP